MHYFKNVLWIVFVFSLIACDPAQKLIDMNDKDKNSPSFQDLLQNSKVIETDSGEYIVIYEPPETLQNQNQYPYSDYDSNKPNQNTSSGPDSDKCQGCCSSHGGVICSGGVTKCTDGTPLSDICREKGCNACGV